MGRNGFGSGCVCGHDWIEKWVDRTGEFSLVSLQEWIASDKSLMTRDPAWTIVEFQRVPASHTGYGSIGVACQMLQTTKISCRGSCIARIADGSNVP